jgi:uncharacterized protein (TIGR03437 family)
LTPGSEARVVVKVGDMESPPVTINISPSETGIFTYGANRAVATNQDSRLNTFAEPAARGSVITVYVTGQGALSNPIPTGQPAPSAPLSQTTFDATATIGGTPASVEFLGATPGFVGLSQANITVPGNAPTGEQKLQITVGGHASNETVINIK